MIMMTVMVCCGAPSGFKVTPKMRESGYPYMRNVFRVISAPADDILIPDLAEMVDRDQARLQTAAFFSSWKVFP